MRLPARCAMKMIKNIFSKLYLYVLWAMFSVIFVGWTFTMITDTIPKHKVTVYVDVLSLEEIGLREELEKSKPDDIKMVKAYPFTYATFSAASILYGDLYIIKESDVEEYLSSFSPLSEDLLPAYTDRGLYVSEGVAYGIKVYDAGTETGCATAYINYAPLPEEEAEDYYLFFNRESFHTGELNGSEDDAALIVADAFLSL